LGGLAEAMPAASIEAPAMAPDAAVAMRIEGTRRRNRDEPAILLVIFFLLRCDRAAQAGR
jgi:hypothetical protein